MQNHYNLIYREEEREMIPLCRAEGIGLIPWSPLARGFLAGNRSRDKGEGQGGATTRAQTDGFAKEMYYQPEDFTVAERVGDVAKKLGKSAAQVALAWVAGRPGITSPIIGASKPGQIEAAVEALSINLSDEDVKLLEEPYRPHSVLGHE
jgi:aryl-alcohol dehydrogenase (NADP+)